MANLVGIRVGDAADRKAAERVPTRMTLDILRPRMTLKMSLVKVSSVMSFDSKCLRSPSPVCVGVNTWRPAARKPVSNPAPAPAAMPGAMNQHERLRRGLRLCCSSAPRLPPNLQ